jgi:hypothetical protein
MFLRLPDALHAELERSVAVEINRFSVALGRIAAAVRSGSGR